MRTHGFTRTLITAATVIATATVIAGCAGQNSAPQSSPQSEPNAQAPAATQAPAAQPAAPGTQTNTQAEDFLATHNLTGLDAAAVIEKLDTLPVAQRPTDMLASVRQNTLDLADAQGRKAQLPMPTDKVYISIAPYENQTHDCMYHSLTTCKGELANTDVAVTLTSTTGDVLINETRTTYDNGFFGIWVPRGTAGTLEVSYQGKTGTAQISATNADDLTCITTLKMA